jgi:RNA 2',3'-cyclic 3'-phosphodiesterase
MMRLFVALELPDDIKDTLAALKVDGRRTKRDQFHLTLRFIGDGIELPQVNAIKQALAEISAAPFEMQFRGVGQFPPKKPARVLWVGIAPNPALDALAKQIEAAVVKAGLAPEDRPFSAHMTLSRLDPPKDAREFLERYPAFESRTMPVEEFILFSSVLSPQGATHRREAVYPLK